MVSSLNHFIRPRQQRWWDRQAEGLGGLGIDDHLELGWLLDRKIRRFHDLQDFVHERRSASRDVHSVRTDRHQSPGVRDFSESVYGWQSRLRGEVSNLLAEEP